MKNGDSVRIKTTGETGRILMVIKDFNSAYVIVNKERFIYDLKELAAV